MVTSDPREDCSRQRHRVEFAIGSAVVAMLLAWLAISTWSWKLWLILGVGVLVFLIATYYSKTPLLLRMARSILGMLFVTNAGGVGIRFFAYYKDAGAVDFALESSTLWASAFLTVCFLGSIAAHICLNRAEIKTGPSSDCGVCPSRSNTVNGSICIQNSPGAQVVIGEGASATGAYPVLDAEGVAAIREHTEAVKSFIALQDAPMTMRYTTRDMAKQSTFTPEIAAVSMGEEFRLEHVGPTNGGPTSASSTEGIRQIELADLLDTLQDVQDIAIEIRRQLSLWNEPAALVLVNSLESKLAAMDKVAPARLPEYLFLAARVHVICAEKKERDATEHLNRARAHLEQIEQLAPGDPLAADVVALRGSIANIENHPDAALALLGDIDTPYGIRIRMAMHLNKKDPDSAIVLIHGKEPHLHWCDLAVTAYAAKGRLEDAQRLTDWAKQQTDDSKHPQCVVRFADVSLGLALSGQRPGKHILPHDLSTNEQAKVRKVLEILAPVLNPILAASIVESGLATAAVRIAWQAYHLLGERDNVAKMARLMATRTPIPMDVARSVVSGYIQPANDLPKRLREDYPDDLDALALAAVVQSQMGQHSEAFNEAKSLVVKADTKEKKEELFKLFQQLWQGLEGKAVIECEKIARTLIKHDDNLLALLDAAMALRAGNGKKALQLLERSKAKDDVYWIQLRGNALLQMGRTGDAVDLFLHAANRTGLPTLYHKAADLAYQAKQFAVAVDCYEKLVVAETNNLVARGNLASLYTFHIHDIQKAAEQFAVLHNAEPTHLVHTVNLAVCLAQLYNPQESLALYNEACATNEPELRAVIGRAELLLSIGKPDEALRSLQAFRAQFWDAPEFVYSCMNTAYAAGEEGFAHQTLCKLNELRATGKVDEKAFRIVQTDEALEMFKAAAKATEEQKKTVHSLMLKGHMPWVWAAQVSKAAVYWAWRERTQELRWYADDPVNRASYCIYTTNGFYAREDEDGRRALLPLECPPAGTPVVADLSALISLHRFGLLEQTAEYFGEILVPQAYLQTVLEDSRKMILHQRSRKQTAEKISRFISAGSIIMFDEPEEAGNKLPLIDEYIDSDEHFYRLIDLIQPVYLAGLLDDTTYKRIITVCGKPSGVNEAHPALARLQDIVVELSTLEVVSAFGLLEPLAEFYKIHIAKTVQKELNDRLEAIQFQEETRGWHFDLWDKLRNNARFRFVKHTVPAEMQERDMDTKDLMAFWASFVAQESGMPLLADDRVCQAFTLNEAKGRQFAAFGSDALVRSLLSESKLDEHRAADAFLSLMRWRYRFILPPVKVLKELASRYKGSAPGKPLQDIAEYVHDCMRDTGLFGGPENTDAKESMALRLSLAWLNLAAEFLLDVWSDSDFEEQTARRLTEWCVMELLPSQPRVIPGNAKARTAELTSRLLISHILIHANTLNQDERISAALAAIQSILNLSDDEYLHIVTGILNDTRKT